MKSERAEKIRKETSRKTKRKARKIENYLLKKNNNFYYWCAFMFALLIAYKIFE